MYLKLKKNIIMLLFILVSVDLTQVGLQGMDARYAIENAIYSFLIIFISLLDALSRKGLRRKELVILLLFIFLILITYFAKGSISTEAIASTFRLCIVFLVFTYDIEDEDLRVFIKKLIIFVPLISLFIGIIYTILNLRSFYVIEYTGALRLQGAKGAAHYSLLCIPALLLTFYEISKNDKNYKLILMSVINTLLLILTAARTSTALIVIVILLFVILRVKRKRFLIPFLLGSLVFTLLGILFGEQIMSKILSRTISEDGTINDSGRSFVWELLYQRIFEQPYLGYGGGEATILLVNNSDIFRSPHNEYLHYIFDYGLIGFFIILVYVINNFKILGNKEFMTYFIIIFFILSFTDNTLSTLAFEVPFFLVISVIKKESFIKQVLSKQLSS